jgi:hypothetical protein
MLLAGRMVGPIRALRAGAARIGSGDLSQRIAIKTGDELEALGLPSSSGQALMAVAGITGGPAVSKGLRHGFGVPSATRKNRADFPRTSPRLKGADRHPPPSLP